MSSRTTHSIAQFKAPFMLGGAAEPLPPGDYDIDHAEEQIDGISRVAWRRVATFIHVPARGVKSQQSQLLTIGHADLEAALQRDRDATG